MAFPKGKTKRENMLSAEEYGEARRLFGELISGENNPMYGKDPWNKGLTKEIDNRVLNYGINVSKTKTGVPLGPNSEQAKIHKSQAQLKRALEHPESFANCGHPKGWIPITNDLDDTHYISPDEPIPDGYRYGFKKIWT